MIDIIIAIVSSIVVRVTIIIGTTLYAESTPDKQVDLALWMVYGRYSLGD